MAKQQKPKRVNVLIDRTVTIPRNGTRILKENKPERGGIIQKPYELPSLPTAKPFPKVIKETLVRDSSIPLAPTQFND